MYSKFEFSVNSEVFFADRNLFKFNFFGIYMNIELNCTKTWEEILSTLCNKSLCWHCSTFNFHTNLYDQRLAKLTLRPKCTESFKPGLSLKLGLKPEKGLKSYAYHKT